MKSNAPAEWEKQGVQRSQTTAEKMAARVILACVCMAALASCGKPQSATSPTTPESGVKRYHLTGRVISVEKRANSVMIDGDDVPGFMGAMAMPYTVKDGNLFNTLLAGDQISAEIVVKGDDSWLENVKVTGHTNPPKPAATLHFPAAGEPVPDFKFVDQDDHRISIRQYRGKALLLTFIYTQCPFPDYCPRLTHQFAEINKLLDHDASLRHQVRLLSISFDVAHDTPRVLRAYALHNANKSADLFQSWQFATPGIADLNTIANFFGLDIQKDGKVLNHSLSTAVIGPDGNIFKWYHDADWQPADLVKDAADALRPAGNRKIALAKCGAGALARERPGSL
jgi:protein SCO1/2